MQAVAAKARFLSSKQRFDVWLELATPEAHGQQGDEVFQVDVSDVLYPKLFSVCLKLDVHHCDADGVRSLTLAMNPAGSGRIVGCRWTCGCYF